MPKGTVKWFGAQHGCGFVVPDDGGAHSFVHISEGQRLQSEGQRLEYGLNRNKGRRFSTFKLRLVE